MIVEGLHTFVQGVHTRSAKQQGFLEFVPLNLETVN